VRKFVRPTKFLGSWPPHQSGIDQLLFSQAESQVRARAAGSTESEVLRVERSTSLGAFANPTKASNVVLKQHKFVGF